MTKKPNILEAASWILMLAAPWLCIWIPAKIFHRGGGAPTFNPHDYEFNSTLIHTVLPALTFLFLAVFIHIKKRNTKGDPVNAGITCAFVAAVVSQAAFYIFFWITTLKSIGVNFGLIFAFLLSPIIICCAIIPIAYVIGGDRAKGKSKEEGTAQ